jgi:hypothetical protein
MPFQKGNQYAKGNPPTKSSFKKGNIPWNKGKINIYSIKTREKMSIAHIGKEGYWKNKKRPYLWLNKIKKVTSGSFKKGHISYWKGKKRPRLSKEWREKIKNSNIGKHKGPKHPNWKGGININSQGYILIHKPQHPFCSSAGYVRRSHLVMEKMIGRYLIPEEVVHHKGTKYPLDSIENKQDDRPKNLQLFINQGEHQSFHKKLTSSQL